MNTKVFGPLAAAGLTVLCGLSVLELPTPGEIAMIAGATLLLASAGGLIGAAVAARKPTA